jgi:IclR family transcriptional regulator, blcABC operon repressor
VGILEELARSPEPLSLTELGRRLDLAKSTVANLCAALEACRMVRRDGGRWALDHKVVELGQGFLAGTSVVDEFLRLASVLPVAASETVLLSVLDDRDVVYLAQHNGKQDVHLASDVGRRVPAVMCAAGKAMLAHWSLAPLDDLDEIRAQGFAVQNGVGVTGYGVALGGGRLIGAVSVAILSARETPELRIQLVADLHRLAAHLTAVSAH